jgi:hypothetical protein
MNSTSDYFIGLKIIFITIITIFDAVNIKKISTKTFVFKPYN